MPLGSVLPQAAIWSERSFGWARGWTFGKRLSGRWVPAQAAICVRLRSHRHPFYSIHRLGGRASSAMLLARDRSEFRMCAYHAIATMVVDAPIL